MTIIVETDRLSIRPWTLDDAPDAYAMYGDPEVTRFLPDALKHTSVDETRSWLERRVLAQDTTNPLGFWAVVVKGTGRVVGAALLDHAPINGGSPVELGYHLARDAWGQGFATEIARALLRYGFETVGLDQIVAAVIPGNDASRHVLEKIGMQSQGMGDYRGFPVEVFQIDRSNRAAGDSRTD